MSDLPTVDRRDMSDPFLLLSTSILMNRLKSNALFQDFAITLSKPSTPPWGLNITIEKPLHEFLKEQSEVLIELQKVIFAEYKLWSSVICTANQEDILRAADSLPAMTVRMLQLIANTLRRQEDVDSAHLFTKGGAVTYTLLENLAGQTMINVHPRLMSKGNSADAMGIYVDNFEGEQVHDLEKKRVFYRQLIARMAMIRTIKNGMLLTREGS
jgi:hypothetical protein